MNVRLLSLTILSAVCVTSFATPINLLNINFKSYRPVIALFGGASWINGQKNTQLLAGTDDEVFTYRTQEPDSANGYWGGFLGVERALPYHDLSLQIGIEYDRFATTNLNGNSLAGVQGNTSTLYVYHYQIATQQVMGAVKLLGTLELPKIMPYRLHPYFSVALGSAFNTASQFTTNPVGDASSFNLTPIFANASDTQFSYNLGLGVDADITAHLRLGIGYRYSNFGQISLGRGTITVNQYRSSIGSALRYSNVSANQFLAQLTFIA